MPDEPPTHREIDAKFEAAEARAETRFVELSGKIDRVADSIGNLSSTVTSELQNVRTELRTVKSDNTFTRWTIVLAVLAAIGALWVTQANLLTAFQAGLTLKTEQAPPPTTAPQKKGL
jgi:hypothetical protein